MATTRHIPVKFNPLDIAIYKERVSTMKYLTQGNLDYARELALMSLEAAEGYIAQIECDKNTIAELKVAMKTFNGGPADEQVKKYKEIAAHGMQAAELAQARVQDLELELAACRASKAETSSEEAKPSVRERDLQHQINMVNEDRRILEKKLGDALKEIAALKQQHHDELQCVRADVKNWSVKYTDADREHAALAAEHENLKEDHVVLQDKCADLLLKYTAKAAGLDSKEQELAKTKQRYDELQESYIELRKLQTSTGGNDQVEALKEELSLLQHKYDNLVLINQANAASEPCNDCTIEELRKELVLAKKVIAGLNNSNLALMSAMEGIIK